jgi:hypothetical protein
MFGVSESSWAMAATLPQTRMDAAVVIKRRCLFMDASFAVAGYVAVIELCKGDIDPSLSGSTERQSKRRTMGPN